jgi:cell division transport system permease protein
MTLELEDGFISGDNLSVMAETLSAMKSVSDVYYPERWLHKAEYSLNLITKLIMVLGTIISVTIVLNLLYALRLSVRSRHEEIYQLRLLGAGKMFLSIPYIFEGLFYGLVASAAGWLVVNYANQKFDFKDVDIIFPAVNEMLYFVAAAALIGMISGFISIRRSL